MSDPKAFEIRAGDGRSVWWSGGSLITVLFGDETVDGPFALAVQWCPPGYEAPLHVHHEHEEVLLSRGGGIDIYYGSDEDDLGVAHTDPGDAVYIEGGAPHGFTNVADEPRSLYILFETPLEQGFLEAGVPVETPADHLPTAPKEISESEVLGTLPPEYATDVLGPLPTGD